LIKRILFALLLLSSLLNAELFKKTNFGLGVTLGGGSLSTIENGTQTYTILGISTDYFVIDNLVLL